MKNLVVLNNRGYVLAEMLLSFFIFMIILTLLLTPFRLILDKQFSERALQEMEWDVFILELKKETKLSQGISVSNNKLVLYVDGRVVTYEKYGSSIRRRVDSTGHEVALQGINKVDFIMQKNGFRVKVVDRFGMEKETSVISYLTFLE